MLKEFKEAQNFLEEALELSESNNYKDGIADSCYNLGIYCLSTGKKEEGLIYARRAVNLFLELENLYKVAQESKLSERFNSLLGNLEERDEDVKISSFIENNLNKSTSD